MGKYAKKIGPKYAHKYATKMAKYAMKMAKYEKKKNATK